MGLKDRLRRLKHRAEGPIAARELEEIFLSNGRRLRALANGEEPESEHPRVRRLRDSPDPRLRDSFFGPVQIEQSKVEDLSEP